MLFNSYEFMFFFLPIALLVFFLLARLGRALAATWFAAVSLCFYGWWDPRYIPLLLASIAFNYGMGSAIARFPGRSRAKALLVAALSVNLALLAGFKYTDFAIDSVNAMFGIAIPHAELVLPLGISFFTFTQISFLVDVYRGQAREPSFIHYTLFVTFFPHLIAGPVLHHSQMMPQFALPSTYRFSASNLAMGLSLFTVGLAKKVLFADTFGEYVAPVFGAAEDGVTPGFVVCWIGALAYTLQIYFDFSGYCDMAIGLSRMFGIDLPINFNSPYKAWNIIEFWRRWHMTLSQFLRDYLYIPLGGNRFGPARRYLNLMITMLLGGLWHGASWTFVVWGGLHGAYLITNHLWRNGYTRLGYGRRDGSPLGRSIGTGITFFAVVVAWVYFRAHSLDSANTLVAGMFGFNGIGFHHTLIEEPLVELRTLGIKRFLGCLMLGLIIVWAFPNSQTLVIAKGGPASRLGWSPSLAWALSYGLLLGVSLLFILRTSEFLYFQF